MRMRCEMLSVVIFAFFSLVPVVAILTQPPTSIAEIGLYVVLVTVSLVFAFGMAEWAWRWCSYEG